MGHKKSLTNTFVAMAVADRPASLQVLWRFIAIVRDCNWCNQFNREHFGAFMIVKGHGPVNYCGEGLSVALHGLCGPNAAYQMTYSANCPCGEGLIVAFFDKCGLLGVLAILTLGNVHAIFGILAHHLRRTH
jgi:hypothetical protein